MRREKRRLTLIEAVEECELKLKIAVTRPLESILQEFIKEKGLEKRVELIGFRAEDELKELVKKSRAVVLPSKWYENEPYCVMEATGYGKPIIVSSFDGVPELVDVNGYVS